MKIKNESRLWSTIADAMDAYRRRLIVSADSYYENTWRLIHIQEAIIKTLGMTIASRMIDLYCQKNNKKALLQLISKQLLSSGCINQGYINAWLDFFDFFIKEFDKEQKFRETNNDNEPIITHCPFLQAVKNYLLDESFPTLMFLNAWQKIEVSPQNISGSSRLYRFRAINNLRNKVAHVPISPKIFKALHSELRKEIILALHPDASKNINADDPRLDPLDKFKPFYPVLCGIILEYSSHDNSCRYITGTNNYGHYVRDFSVKPEFTFYFEWFSEKSESYINWGADPFIRLDSEIKPSLLSRINGVKNHENFLQKGNSGEDIIGEYHRFVAELEPIQEYVFSSEVVEIWKQCLEFESQDLTQDNESRDIDEQIEDAISSTSNETKKLLKEDEPLNAFDVRKKAITAYRQGEYISAVDLYERLSEFNDEKIYNHTAKKEHGAALWRKANRLTENEEQSSKEFQESLKILRLAAEHDYKEKAAEAVYELSKALYHYSKKQFSKNKISLFQESLKKAKEAAALSFSSEYLSWLRKIDQESIE